MWFIKYVEYNTEIFVSNKEYLIIFYLRYYVKSLEKIEILFGIYKKMIIKF